MTQTAQPPDSNPSPQLQARELEEQIRANKSIGPIVGREIIGDLNLDSVSFDHKLVLRNSTFKGHLNLRDARMDRSVDLSGCHFEKTVNFSGAVINGSLMLQQARFAQAEQPQELVGIDKISPFLADFERVRVQGNFDAAGVDSAVAFDLTDARIEGQFYGSSLPQARTTFHLDLHCANIVVGGQMLLAGVRIGGDLQLQGAELKKDLFLNPSQGKPSEILGDAFLAGITVQGEVHLSGINIGGTLVIHNSKIKEDMYCEPHHDGATEHPMIVQKDVYMPDTEVGGILSFQGARVAGKLDVRGFKGDLRCGAWPAEADGHGAKGRILGSFGGPLDASGCRCRTVVIDGRVCNTGVNLSLGQVDRIEIEQQLCERPNLEGLRFTELLLPDETTVGELLDKVEPFQRSTYATVERWLRDRGRDDEADDLYLRMRRRNRQFGMARRGQLGDWFLDFSMRYGIKSYRLVIVLVVLLAVSFLVYLLPSAIEPKPSVQKAGAPFGAPPTVATVGQKFWLAFKTAIPVVAVFSADDWRPSSQPIQFEMGGCPYRLRNESTGWALRYDQFASGVSAVSWIVVPLFLAGITGFVRKR